jgi:UDP-N-acetylglucosamine 2-epimerase
VHVEAWLRSYDRVMPEELNRRVVGVLADLHCAPTGQAVANLRREGVPDDSILLTGNTIVEATTQMAPDDATARAIAASLGAEPGEYVLATIHRPENTDDPQRLQAVLDELGKLGLPVLFPLHPRTRLAAARHGLTPALDRLQIIRPITGRSCPWPGTRALSCLTLAGCRKSAQSSRGRSSWSGTPPSGRKPSTPDSLTSSSPARPWASSAGG